MEPKDSLPCSEESAISPYSDPALQSTPSNPVNHFKCLGPSNSLSLETSQPKCCTYFSFPPVCYMPHPHYSPRFAHSNNIWIQPTAGFAYRPEVPAENGPIHWLLPGSSSNLTHLRIIALDVFLNFMAKPRTNNSFLHPCKLLRWYWYGLQPMIPSSLVTAL